MPTFHRRDNGVYYFIVEIDDKQKWISLRTKKRPLGRQRYDDMCDKYDRGLLDLKQKKAIPTLQELFDEYLPYCKKHKSERTYRDAESHIRLFLSPYFGKLRAMDLEPKHIEQFTGNLLDCKDPETGKPIPYHPRTINLRLETLRKILLRAVDNTDLPEMPCKIKMLKVPDSLPRYAYPEDIKEWMSYLGTPQRLRAIVSVMTGITDKDLGYVMKEGYDRENALIRFRRPKTTTDIVIPLTPAGMQIIDGLIANNPGSKLFQKRSNYRAFLNASKKSVKNGGKHLTPHMLRHTFATWLLSKGVPKSFVQQLLGHKTSRATDRYAKLIPEHLRDAVAQIEIKNLDIAALLAMPRKEDGTKIGGRWTEEQKRTHAERMKGNKKGFRTGEYSGDYEKRISKSLAKEKGQSSDRP